MKLDEQESCSSEPRYNGAAIQASISARVEVFAQATEAHLLLPLSMEELQPNNPKQQAPAALVSDTPLRILDSSIGNVNEKEILFTSSIYLLLKVVSDLNLNIKKICGVPQLYPFQMDVPKNRRIQAEC